MDIISKGLCTIVTLLGGTGICYLATIVLKWHIANLISHTKRLSDYKAELLTRLLSK